MSARGIMNTDVNAAYNLIKIPEAFAAEADGTEGVGCGVLVLDVGYEVTVRWTKDEIAQSILGHPNV